MKTKFLITILSLILIILIIGGCAPKSQPPALTPPNAPSNLTAEALSATEINLTWQDNSDNEEGFKIERRIEGGDWSEIATVEKNVTTFTDTGLSSNTTYYYRVRAYNSAGNSDYSNEASATTKILWYTYDWTTTVEPPTGWIEMGNMNSYCNISDGILIFDSTYTTGTPNYRYEFTEQPPLGFKLTIALKAKADSTTNRAWTFDFQGFRRMGVEISGNQVRLLNGTSSLASTTDITTTNWHTYYITFELLQDGNGDAKVYIDGNSTPTLTGTITASTTNNYMRIGDTSTTAGYQGSIDWIFWTFDCALPPNQVELPAGFPLTP